MAPQMPNYSDILRDLISGERAIDDARALFATDHWFSYRNFARTAEHVATRLRDIGLTDVRIDPIPAENRTKYSGWTTMTAWDIDRGRLRVVSPESRARRGLKMHRLAAWFSCESPPFSDPAPQVFRRRSGVRENLSNRPVEARERELTYSGPNDFIQPASAGFLMNRAFVLGSSLRWLYARRSRS